MLTSYRRILGLPGTLLFSATGMVARMPMAMASLGIVLLVSAATGSYGLAGSVSAAYLVANGAFAIAQGRLLDRHGQARVLPVATAVFGSALALLMWSVQAEWPMGISYVAAAISGAAFPAVGSCVRARWSHVLRSPDELQTAFALEAVVDESVFMLGPILVTVLATAWHPVAGLTAALLTGVVGTLFFAAQRATAPPAHPRQETTGRRPGMPWATVVPLALVSAALGTLFGAAEVTTVAFAEELGSKGYAGPLLALWALGSLIAGLVTGAVHWRRGPDHRVRWGSLGMMTAMLPLGLIGSVPVMGAALFVAGFAIAPTLIATMSLTEKTVPHARLTEGMAIIHTGIVAGVAPGATLAGVVIDTYGASPAYLVAAGAGLVSALAAQAIPRSRFPEPVESLT
ncbi:MFS transporter [Nocardioides sp.]|uniref:MFS transporter n=1 Tax=Nocardioides sp. TaxID=35761 RepID=UPI002D7F544C|nr:MFS transporter [Nocardioides sp.]HET8959630.1 MFS transporter [Nocardioides sp.]